MPINCVKIIVVNEKQKINKSAKLPQDMVASTCSPVSWKWMIKSTLISLYIQQHTYSCSCVCLLITLTISSINFWQKESNSGKTLLCFLSGRLNISIIEPN